MMKRPNHAADARTVGDKRSTALPVRASMAPAINSQARVGSRKNVGVRAHSANHTKARSDWRKRPAMIASAYRRVYQRTRDSA